MSKNPEVEDGMGFSGLAPSHKQRAQERSNKKFRDELVHLRGHRKLATAEIGRLQVQRDNLAMMLRRMIWMAEKETGDTSMKVLAGNARQLLIRHGLEGHPLRNDEVSS